jgi:hypothetical protein
MRSHRVTTAAALLAIAVTVATSCVHETPAVTPPMIMGHAVRVDAKRKLLPWLDRAPYAGVVARAWNTLETKFLPQENGLETWLGYSRFDPDTFDGIAWPHNPAGLYAMLVESALLWYAFSGDSAAVDLARKGLDYQITHGSTPADWSWARCPYASAGAGDAEYQGADDQWCDFCGRGDGIGVIEPDKVGELGVAYLRMFEVTGEPRYRDAALACADALAKHVRTGDAEHSPWPFRVYALTNVPREEYSSNVVGAIELFDELVRLGLGPVETYRRARASAFDWLMHVPMTNDAWSGYFEDIDIHRAPADNPNQYSALRTARWILLHEDADPGWREHVAHLIAWAVDVFGKDTATERGQQWGATVMSEQAADMAKMGSHTARLGATLALWSEATGDAAARDRARRSLNWATYACRDDGVVAVGESREEGFWFSDGYGDYIRHFLVAMAAVPDWAPAGETHLLRSTSLVTRIEYRPREVTWTTFDVDATEAIRLPSRPAHVVAAGTALAEVVDLRAPGSDAGAFTTRALDSGGVVVTIRHRVPGDVVVTLGARD